MITNYSKYLRPALLFIVVIFPVLANYGFAKETQKKGFIKDVSSLEASLLLKNNPSMLVLDVRTKKEIDEHGKIDAKYYTHADWRDDLFLIKIFRLNRDRPVLIYCSSGKRSAKVARLLLKKGFKKIYNLKKGFEDWKEL